jgi:crotonobetainyl-CoA:carnitine CoA-transferase CaiB-like acyl-CoA transferase
MPMLFVDKLTACQVASAVSSALFRRERTGKGCEIQIPMFETATWFNLLEHLWQGARGHAEEGLGFPRMFGSSHRPLPTKDGHICIVASTDMQWHRLFVIVGRPDLADDPRFSTMANRTENIVAAYQLMGEQLASRTTAEWRQLLDAADIVNEPMNDLHDLLEDPHLADIGFFERHEHPTAGAMVTIPHPTLYDRIPATTRLLPPVLGEHTVPILSDLGYSPAAIEEILK